MDREFRDLPLPARLLCIFVLSVAMTAIVVGGLVELNERCDPRPVYVRGAADPGAPPWERP